jgi:hypothetical protein
MRKEAGIFDMLSSKLIEAGAAVGTIGLSAVMTLFLLFPGSIVALAQDPATSLDQIRLAVGQGDKVSVVDSSGNKISGKIDRIAPDGIELRVGSGLRTFQEKEIRQIIRQKQDSPLNGFLIGAGIGFGAMLPVNLALADTDERGLAVAASAIWGLIGGGIGALVDACVHQEQIVFFRPKSSSWNISPVLTSPGNGLAGGTLTKGLRLTIRF